MSSAAVTHSGGQFPARRALAVLPARISSTRLPQKMLLEAAGVPLVVRSAQNVIASKLFARVVVAADDDKILSVCRKHAIEAVATRADHPSGSDRVNECVSALVAAGAQADVVVNVQGDEPELAHADFAALLAAFDDARVEMATLSLPLVDRAQFENPNVVKVVCDARGNALYFSRAPIPSRAHPTADSAIAARRHLGVYAFTPQALARFCALPRGALEKTESLEQLRWLEHGFDLRVVAAVRGTTSIDTAADWAEYKARVEAPTRVDDGGTNRALGTATRTGSKAG
ncbi:MAG: 3-deoxy-manno-octulosonate cytidylyltransferase [Planctomycetota bacterium]|nr:3-deoxy-manno-octulosonate cytidylyltransferase [Planctomycetota bacterium]